MLQDTPPDRGTHLDAPNCQGQETWTVCRQRVSHAAPGRSRPDGIDSLTWIRRSICLKQRSWSGQQASQGAPPRNPSIHPSQRVDHIAGGSFVRYSGLLPPAPTPCPFPLPVCVSGAHKRASERIQFEPDRVNRMSELVLSVWLWHRLGPSWKQLDGGLIECGSILS